MSDQNEPTQGGALPSVPLQPVVLAVIEAMEMLKNMAIGGIGEDGPTLEELDSHAETTGRSWDDDADYHTAQWAWRKLEQGLNSQNTSVEGRP